MSWTRYLLHDFWTAQEFNRLEDQQRTTARSRRVQARRDRQERQVMGERIASLEQELGEAVLLLRTLSELALEKGLITPQELQERAEKLDAMDGVVDGRITPPDDQTGGG